MLPLSEKKRTATCQDEASSWTRLQVTINAQALGTLADRAIG
jgi:hypothetical protein